MAETTDLVRIASHDRVRTITLNAPERLNAVDEVMLDALADAVATPPGPDRVIVLRGAGRGFCSGAHLGSVDVGAGPIPLGTLDAANRAVRLILDSPLPVVSVVQGPCAGVGVSLAVAADLVVASTEAFFQLAFTRIALMPDGGATALVAASIGRARAMRMALLAERLTAADALDQGLISHLAEPDALPDEAARVIAALADGPANALARTRRAINAATLADLDAAFAREREGQGALLAAADFTEGVAAFTGKRSPAFTDPAPS